MLMIMKRRISGIMLLNGPPSICGCPPAICACPPAICAGPPSICACPPAFCAFVEEHNTLLLSTQIQSTVPYCNIKYSTILYITIGNSIEHLCTIKKCI